MVSAEYICRCVIRLFCFLIGSCWRRERPRIEKLDRASEKYKELESQFSNSWYSQRGRVPKIRHILQIINPSARRRFDKYLASLPWFSRNIEQYYHGTELRCNKLQYNTLCSNSKCGACGIAKEGFDPQCINSSAWQRFGNGFYFAPNSSKAYDYIPSCWQLLNRSPPLCAVV